MDRCAILRGGDRGCLDRLDHTRQFGFGVTKPVRAPDSVDRPPLQSEYLFSQTVAISGRSSAVVLCAIALDPKQVTPWLSRIGHSKVDEKARGPHLAVHSIACLD